MWPFADVDAMQNETTRGNKVVDGQANTSIGRGTRQSLNVSDAGGARPAIDGVMRRQRK
jgi:hypothetical protein